MKLQLLLPAGLIIQFGLMSTACCEAAAVVVANRTDEQVAFEIHGGDEGWTPWRLQPKQCLPIPVSGRVELRVKHRIEETFELRPFGIYYFGQGSDGLQFHEIGLSSPDSDADDADGGKPELAAADSSALATVQVRVFVDDELFSRRDPEPRVAERIRAASIIFEQAARVRFEVVSFDTWESIDHVTDFEALLVDFERKVRIEPGHLAIGFSTQASRSKKRMGATRLPLHSHILVRERGQRVLSAAAQLELLVHELGHYLGAAHSPEWNSAMRPQLGDGLAGSEGFRIGLDPVNTMVVYLIGQQLRTRQRDGIWDLSAPVKSRLKRIYRDLARTLPADPAAKEYLKAMNLKAAPLQLPRNISPMAQHVRKVVQAVTAAAEENVQRSEKSVADRFGKPFRLRRDRLLEEYVRRAAEAAVDLPADVRPRAFAIGLAVAMDQSDLLRDNLITRTMWRSSESGRENRFRRGVLGQPTIRGRDDLAQHFCISAGLAALFGTQIAEAAGVLKEVSDGKFSRADYAADLAGIRFYEHLAQSAGKIEVLATHFRIEDYVPLCEEARRLEEETRHPPSTAEQKRWREEILQEIEELPGYVDGD